MIPWSAIWLEEATHADYYEIPVKVLPPSAQDGFPSVQQKTTNVYDARWFDIAHDVS